MPAASTISAIGKPPGRAPLVAVKDRPAARRSGLDGDASDVYHRYRYPRSQTPARPAKENVAHNGSMRREATVLYLQLAGPDRRTQVHG